MSRRKIPKKRHIIASVLFGYACVALYLNGKITMAAIGVLALAVQVELGAYALDSFKLGPFSMKSDDE